MIELHLFGPPSRSQMEGFVTKSTALRWVLWGQGRHLDRQVPNIAHAIWSSARRDQLTYVLMRSTTVQTAQRRCRHRYQRPRNPVHGERAECATHAAISARRANRASASPSFFWKKLADTPLHPQSTVLAKLPDSVVWIFIDKLTVVFKG